ncbi:competence protein CoiA [Fervidibacillus halotolerans]|uniref:Competence protein CoiA family protein n=1 Tax=Fervidibacillus halotolerans TaxID=2980027 RepID=A0A9E8M266_9BACI|nr:competence protein CoiA family protein [Fervidibacillus halotolerans]WAA13866.1 competence protein CoiA family protein [Fervidibacillus halotolerans]
MALNRLGVLRTVLHRSYAYVEGLKKEAPFYCPDCKQEVILKIGKRKLPHFAHKSVCPAKGEGETVEHIKGKIALYQWLKNNGFTPVIEKFLREINQRPDIFFHWKGMRTAVEFQCSPIPQELLKKRTEQYKNNGIVPIWIIHEKLIRKSNRHVMHFTDFSTQFIQNIFLSEPFLLSFDPNIQAFFRYTHFIPISKQRAFVKEEIFDRKAKWTDIFAKTNPSFEFYNMWPEKMENWLLTRNLQPGARKDPFLLFFYRHHIHPTMFPPEVGLPLPYMYMIINSPFEWQAYLWHRFFYGKKRGDYFSTRDIQNFLLKEMNGMIHWRSFPLLKLRDKNLPVWHYFRFFVKIGTLRKEGDTFIIKKPVEPIPLGRDGFGIRKDFFRRYKGILLKNLVD